MAALEVRFPQKQRQALVVTFESVPPTATIGELDLVELVVVGLQIEPDGEASPVGGTVMARIRDAVGSALDGEPCQQCR